MLVRACRAFINRYRTSADSVWKAKVQYEQKAWRAPDSYRDTSGKRPPVTF
jgi:hypothetical protein